jgi:RNA polymerase sigma factor (TIGR02999 family)
MTSDPERPDSTHEISRLLLAWRAGEEGAYERLVPLVYDELRRLAHRQARNERGHTLDTTALVHEAYLRLVGLEITWEGRDHFFALCARLMRRILVDAARKRRAEKRGGGAQHLPLFETELAVEMDADLVDLDRALKDLEELDERKSRAIEMRFFAGLPAHAIAEVLGVSSRTIERDLGMALAWLRRQLDRAGDTEPVHAARGPGS